MLADAPLVEGCGITAAKVPADGPVPAKPSNDLDQPLDATFCLAALALFAVTLAIAPVTVTLAAGQMTVTGSILSGTQVRFEPTHTDTLKFPPQR